MLYYNGLKIIFVKKLTKLTDKIVGFSTADSASSRSESPEPPRSRQSVSEASNQG